MFCSKCGSENADGDKFCVKCGAPMRTAGTGSTGSTGSTTSLEPNVAALLCYVAGWITGLVFILIEKENDFVRFHAMQSILVFGTLHAAGILFSGILGLIPYAGIFFHVVGGLVWLVAVVLWVLLMVKAYNGERYGLPYAGDFAERHI